MRSSRRLCPGSEGSTRMRQHGQITMQTQIDALLAAVARLPDGEQVAQLAAVAAPLTRAMDTEPNAGAWITAPVGGAAEIDANTMNDASGTAEEAAPAPGYNDGLDDDALPETELTTEGRSVRRWLITTSADFTADDRADLAADDHAASIADDHADSTADDHADSADNRANPTANGRADSNADDRADATADVHAVFPLPTNVPIPLPTTVPIPLLTTVPIPLPTIVSTPLPTTVLTPLPTIVPTQLPACRSVSILLNGVSRRTTAQAPTCQSSRRLTRHLIATPLPYSYPR